MSPLDQKCVHYFDHVDLMNALMALTMPSASCDANASASGVTYAKCHINHLDLTNAMVPMIMLLSCDTSTKCITLPKK